MLVLLICLSVLATLQATLIVLDHLKRRKRDWYPTRRIGVVLDCDTTDFVEGMKRAAAATANLGDALDRRDDKGAA